MIDLEIQVGNTTQAIKHDPSPLSSRGVCVVYGWRVYYTSSSYVRQSWNMKIYTSLK